MQRIEQLKTFGGLPDNTHLSVKNREWLYMLEEETRHSLSIEGYFATEQELKAVIKGKKTYPEILNYYRTAQSIYDLALQYHREEGELWEKVSLDLPFIKHVHSELFREVSQQRGRFRPNSISIQGAKVQPPAFDIDEYMRAFIKLVPKCLKESHPITVLAKLHTLFESIHPFNDGNGRVGRILLNFIAIVAGLPPIIIKGVEQAQREAYYHALEQADKGFHQGFPAPSGLARALNKGDFEALEQLLIESVLPQLDTMLVLTLERTETLVTFEILASELEVKPNTLRKWVERGKLIAIKRDNKLWSHPTLVLESRAT